MDKIFGLLHYLIFKQLNMRFERAERCESLSLNLVLLNRVVTSGNLTSLLFNKLVHSRNFQSDLVWRLLYDLVHVDLSANLFSLCPKIQCLESLLHVLSKLADAADY